MKYNLSKKVIKNDLLCETLKAMSECLSKLGIPLYVVGATARDLAMLLCDELVSKRRTNDLDVAIAIPDWDMFDNVAQLLLQNNFKKLKPKQKFVYQGIEGHNDYEVDLVPFGAVAENEVVKWRPDGEPLMSVRCFEDVMRVAIDVQIEEGISIRIAPIYGQFLIKLDAWFDRRADKDVEDIMYFLKEYYLMSIMRIDSEHPIPDFVGEEKDPTLLLSGARWLACDASKILSNEHLEYYIKLINNEIDTPGDSLLLAHSMKYVNASIDEAFDLVTSMWMRISLSFAEELKNRQQ